MWLSLTLLHFPSINDCVSSFQTINGNSRGPKCLSDPAVFSFRSISSGFSPLTPVEEPSCAYWRSYQYHVIIVTLGFSCATALLFGQRSDPEGTELIISPNLRTRLRDYGEVNRGAEDFHHWSIVFRENWWLCAVGVSPSGWRWRLYMEALSA